MKPLGKAVKIALDTNRPLQQAIDDLLSDYRSTPHPATGVAPGNMIFRWGIIQYFHQPQAPLSKSLRRPKNKTSSRNKPPMSESTNHNGANIPTLSKAMKC